MEAIQVNPVFLALMRPPMFMGVVIDYFLLVLMSVLIAFMVTKAFSVFLLLFPLHLAGWVICKIDPCFFNVFFKSLDFKTSSLKQVLGVQSYAPW